MITLTYSQLRQIMALSVSNGTIKAKLEDFLAGKIAAINEVQALEMIASSEVDKDLIRILTGKDPDTMEMFEALEVIASFFVFIRANKEKFSSWLRSLGYAVQAVPASTKGKGLK